ncbi:histidinol-phosphate transaminase [Luteimonas deserti]|uniref:Histidinol-phosphate aminotransferase n=1 Tax=Luteimonas deserti TaxID=2752306 RepID=A0A7Z0TX41_9GAMM|nr:histidinol-phosphate transaminase [Luteimonas deserti]NYZ64054.1 histidinol-phosphate transaminase [Luteimonas deserti]
MSSVRDLVREDLRDFAGYSSARTQRLEGDVWLNANEAPLANPGDAEGRCRRYPSPQPPELQARLAEVYGIEVEQLLIGRGSDEAIDLLVRALCVPGRDAVLATPPVFGMYAVSARLQGAAFVEVPLIDGPDGFAVDVAAVRNAALARNAKLVFLCSPSNPTGGLVHLAEVDHLADALTGRAIVVVDEAYIEFAGTASATTLLAAHENLVVLRTLSKAHALAAARIGVAIGHPDLIAVLRRCQAPYPVPTPCADLALTGLSADALALTQARVTETIVERDALAAALADMPGVRQVYPSAGNYLLVRFVDADRAFAALLSAGIVVRDQRAAPQLGDALRISLGTPAQNARVLSALQALEIAA